jgi:hypothetical protein
MKYFSIDLSTIFAGLTHQIENLKTLIKYCYKHEYILILPQFRLYGLHNNHKEIRTNLSTYIDFKTLIVNNNYYEVVTNEVDSKDIIYIKSKHYMNGLLCNDDMFMNLEWIPITFSYNKNIITIGKQISNILNNYICIHVRRGDRNITKQIDKDTSPNSILTKIKKHDIKNVYIMTNENISFFDSLKSSDYNIYFFNDFDILKKIKEEDNYLLFCIETEICKLADKKISTFKTPLTYYNDYLTDTPGWQ